MPATELAPSDDSRLAGSEDDASRIEPERWKPLGTLTEEVVGARRAVLALKLGQVLQENVLDLSVGTESAEALLNERLVAQLGGSPLPSSSADRTAQGRRIC
ncbi:MAG: hypothetical protein OXH69_00305 [Acidobacteria bacterium]|nr:hypothetical protein [Acidobacteriota bacterium]